MREEFYGCLMLGGILGTIIGKFAYNALFTGALLGAVIGLGAGLYLQHNEDRKE